MAMKRLFSLNDWVPFVNRLDYHHNNLPRVCVCVCAVLQSPLRPALVVLYHIVPSTHNLVKQDIRIYF